MLPIVLVGPDILKPDSLCVAVNIRRPSLESCDLCAEPYLVAGRRVIDFLADRLVTGK